MPIVWKRGDIFASECQALVCPVNTIGVMGAGLALEFKRRAPGLEAIYKAACKSGQLRMGTMLVCLSATRRIVCLPTKQSWRHSSKIEYVERSLKTLVAGYKLDGFTSIAFPALGCGLGGLDWRDVRPLMERYLSDLDILVEIYEPEAT